MAVCARCEGRERPAKVRFERADGSLAERFFGTVKSVLLRPSHFVRTLDLDGRLGPALKFGVACIVIGQLAFLFWVLLLMRPVYQEQVAEMAADLGLSARRYQLFRIGLIPFDALARVAIYSLLLQVGVLLSGGGRAFRYRDYVRLLSYASAAYLLLLVPLIFGVVLAFAYVLLICAQAVRYHHRLSKIQTFVATVPLAAGMVLLEISGGF